LVARLLAIAALWVRIQTSLKNTKQCPTHDSPPKNKRKKYCRQYSTSGIYLNRKQKYFYGPCSLALEQTNGEYNTIDVLFAILPLTKYSRDEAGRGEGGVPATRLVRSQVQQNCLCVVISWLRR
jgi:hypothetical protein